MTQDSGILENSKGRIFQINVSQGGVPKLAISETEINFMGLVGDQQRNLDVHGGLERAVTLYSLERILALQEEGHWIYPGAVGENLTLTGLDWSKVVPDARLRLGDQVLIEITRYASPCNTIAHVFIDEDYSRISQKRYPNWSRLCARVLRPGVIKVGAPAVFE